MTWKRPKWSQLLTMWSCEPLAVGQPAQYVPQPATNGAITAASLGQSADARLQAHRCRVLRFCQCPVFLLELRRCALGGGARALGGLQVAVDRLILLLQSRKPAAESYTSARRMLLLQNYSRSEQVRALRMHARVNW